MHEVAEQDSKSLQIVESSPFQDYLKQYGLPSDNVIAPTSDKNIIALNLPGFLNSIPQEHKQNALYMSKFISSVAIGRFDSALNDLWNEVVLILRNKADSYGLDLFFDSAVSGDRRSFYNTIEDFSMLKDIVLVQTCAKLEIITDVTSKKLLHILDMRNNIGGSHPTKEIVGPYALMGWLEDCIKNVFLETTTPNSLEIKKIINGIGQEGLDIDETYLQQLDDQLKSISITLVNNLLKILFKKYVSSQSDILTNNIRLIAPTVWENSEDRMKYELGLDIDSYRLNLEQDKKSKAEEFFSICGGNRFKSSDTRSIALSSMIDELENLHYSMNNFYNEGPQIRDIMSYIEQSQDIPNSVAEKLISVILVCRLGNSYGVARTASPYYDKLFNTLNQDQVKILLNHLYKNRQNFHNSLNDSQENRLRDVILLINSKPYTSARIKETIDYLLADNSGTITQKLLTTDFRRYIDSL